MLKNKEFSLFLLLIIILPNIFSKTTLTFNTQDFKPFSYMKNEKVAGPFVDIITAVCDDAGFNVKFKLYPWRRAIAMAKEGRVEGLFVLGKNREREKWLYFSKPVINTEYGFFFRKSDMIKFKTIDDLKGKKYKIGVFGPSNTSAKLLLICAKIEGLTMEMTPDDIAAFKKIPAKRVDGAYSNRDVGLSIISEYGIKNVRYGGKERSLKYYIGLLKSNVSKEDFDKFDRSYIKLYKSGKIKQILDFYKLEISDF